ncbi:MAG: MCE family protein [Hyphomonadaceae bacterium]|nr:MCE family protein [Hyphomonadaceae bacterium]
METRANFVLLGAVAIAGAALLMIFAAWLVGSEWRGGYNAYDVVFQGPIRGLSEGGEVRFNGIKVGEVRDLRLDEEDASRVIARIQVSAATPVRADSVARLEAVGLTGVTLIQLSSGTSTKALLRPRLGSPLPRIVAVPGTVESLLSEENAGRINELLGNLETISAELAKEDSVVSQSAVAARDLAAAARAITELSLQARQDLAGVSSRTAAMLDSTKLAVDRANVAMAQLESAAETASSETLPEITDAARELRRLSRTLESLSADIESDPVGFVNRSRRPTVEVPP